MFFACGVVSSRSQGFPIDANPEVGNPDIPTMLVVILILCKVFLWMPILRQAMRLLARRDFDRSKSVAGLSDAIARKASHHQGSL